MNKGRIYLMRHGEIPLSGETRYIGQLDLPLTARGVDQVRQWREPLSAVRFSRVYCSDLLRCRHTVRLVLGDDRDDVLFEPMLREICLGTWEGLPVGEVKERFPEGWKRRGEDLAGYRPEGGESFADLAARVVPFFRTIAESMEGDVLVVAHAGVNRTILSHVLGMPLNNVLRIGQDYACLNLLDCSTDPYRVLATNLKPTFP